MDITPGHTSLRRHWRRYLLLAVCLGFLTAFLVLPVGLVIVSGLTDDGVPTFKWLAQFFRDITGPEGLINAVKIACATTAGVMLVAVPLALLANHYDFRGKKLASALLMLPMILPPFVGALAMQKLLAQEAGPVNLILDSIGLAKVNWRGGSFWLVVALEVLHLYPIMFLNAMAAMANVDPTMVEASRNLGASRWRTFWRVTIPLIRPGLFAGGTIVFIWSFTELGTPLMLEYHNVLPVQIFDGLTVAGAVPHPAIYARVFVMLSASVGLYAVGKVLFGRSSAVAAGRGVAATIRRPGFGGNCLILAAFGAVTLVAVLPHIGVVLMAFTHRWGMTVLPESWTLEHMRQVFADSKTWTSVVNSLRYASAATVVDIVLGLTIAYLVTRLKVRGRGLLDALAILPLAVPGLVIAGGYVLLTRPGWPLEAIGPARDPTLILIIAYSVRRLPYMVRSITAGLQQTSVTLEEAARNLGASPLRTVLRITVPLIAANVLAGSILAFSFAMLEVSDSLILAQTSEFYPITKQIYELARQPGDAPYRAAALGTFGMLLLTGTLILSSLLLGKKLGTLFRV